MTESIPGVAIFVAKPGAEREVEKLLTSLVAPSRAEEGAVYYNLHRDKDHPRRFVFTEEWKSQAALEAHIAADHVKQVFGVLPDMLESSEIMMLSAISA